MRKGLAHERGAEGQQGATTGREWDVPGGGTRGTTIDRKRIEVNLEKFLSARFV
jgi:hypothetical protein